MSDQFLWGASTSAHQIEGDIENDWAKWERGNTVSRARGARRFGWLRHHRRWSRIKDDAVDPSNYRTGKATNHRELYEQDIALAADLGMNALRVSVSWARLEPSKGQFDEDAIEYYRDVFQTMDDYGITPVVTTWHFTHPTWFADDGGWLADDAVERYLHFAQLLANEYSDLVPYWVTLNEPAGWARGAHLLGNFPPQNRSLKTMRRVRSKLQEAHQQAVPILSTPDNRVGITMAIGAFEAYTDNPINRWIATKLRNLEHGGFIDNVADTLDFLGVNYYYQYEIDVLLRNLAKRASLPRSDMGWPLIPEGLGTVLRDAATHDIPLIITEHGLADGDDRHRGKYITDSLDVIQQCRDDGITVNGYLHWSLLDNVEWDKGVWPRFGLVEVDYDTYERTPRDSAYTYRDEIQSRDWAANW